jgi:hypothetical protein
VPTLPNDPLSAIDARIASLRAARTAAPRFSDAFWEADDLLAWLRAARDEVLRTGRLRAEVAAFLDVQPVGVPIESDAFEPRLPAPLAIVASATPAPAEADEPIVAA